MRWLSLSHPLKSRRMFGSYSKIFVDDDARFVSLSSSKTYISSLSSCAPAKSFDSYLPPDHNSSFDPC